ncbi:hypothetical protein TrVE_jg6260 [Triparma verrucosa]|uniref:Tudor domain-containing protein n=1 Tax=Triparma verrucosa TaxID=1606542 RepID=A0A9W7BNC2_9STRA|nr:hypothetical protein TrVE_jg6260 [Triparma verrucosa]
MWASTIKLLFVLIVRLHLVSPFLPSLPTLRQPAQQFRNYLSSSLSASNNGNDWWSSIESLFTELNKSIQQPQTPLSSPSISISNNTKTLEEVELIKADLRNERQLEKATLLNFQKNLSQIFESESRKEVEARVRLPDPDDLRAVMSATGKGFDVCMSSLRHSLSSTSDINQAVLLASANVSNLDPSALSFVISKTNSSLRECVQALSEVGDDDTLQSIIRVRENRVKNLNGLISLTDDVKVDETIKDEWESFRNDMMSFLESEAKLPVNERQLLPDPSSLRDVMISTGGNFAECMEALKKEIGQGIPEEKAVENAKRMIKPDGIDRKIILEKIEGSRWKIGDDVAVSYSGEYYVAKIMKVMKRKSGDMYEVKYSDGSKSVVGEDKVKDIVK